MKLLLIFFFFSCSSFLVLSQNVQLDSLFKKLKSTKLDSSKTSIYSSIAREYEKIDVSKSFDFGKKALDNSRTYNQTKKTAENLNFLGDLYWYAGDYAASSDYYFEALQIYDAAKDDKGRAICYRNIGWIYQGQKNYELTLTYYYKALSLNKKLGNEKGVLTNYDDLSIVYSLKEDYPKAELFCLKTIAYAEEHNYPSGLAAGHGNLADVLFALDKIDESIDQYKISIEKHKKLNDFYNTAASFIGISESYMAKKEYDLAIINSKEALKIATEHNYNILISDSYYFLAQAYSKTKNFDNAYKYLELYTKVKDSTFNETNAELINEMSAKYEFKKKELLIKSLKDDKLLSEVQLEQEQKLKLFLLIFCSVVVIFTIFLYRTMRQRKKANSSLTDAYKLIELKNKDITDSITYSKKIQQAMLPVDSLKEQLFKDIFIFFQPKDIVSGDFYWYGEKNGSRIIAACDCTGHGVPGALMSMIGTNILNQIINEKGITTPDKILDSLNSEIKKSLRQTDQTTNSKDGMDLALVRFIDSHTIEYSGAQRPLWIIRDNELIEIKPSKFTIGGLHNAGEKHFENHRIELKENDCIYLFTDGIVDQFGGPNSKKFMSKQLRNLLLAIHQHPMKTQQQLVELALEQWQGEESQIDDILVIGIRV